MTPLDQSKPSRRDSSTVDSRLQFTLGHFDHPLVRPISPPVHVSGTPHFLKPSPRFPLRSPDDVSHSPSCLPLLPLSSLLRLPGPGTPSLLRGPEVTTPRPPSLFVPLSSDRWSLGRPACTSPCGVLTFGVLSGLTLVLSSPSPEVRTRFRPRQERIFFFL